MRVEEIIVADSSPLIALARIHHLELLEKLAKRVVVPPGRLHLAVIGTVGLLLRARKGGLIPKLAPLLSQLQQCGIYLRPALVQAVLREAGE